MKKYKLVKKYPGSPELGIEVSHSSPFRYYIHDDGKTRIIIPCSIVEDNPEFWQEVVEKEYEILSLKSTYNNKTIIDYENGGGIYKIDQFPRVYKSKDNWIKCFLDSGVWLINSIKRLSDGEVFTVGDKVNTKYIIQSIYIDKDKNDLRFIASDKVILARHTVKLQNKLFTTEDGIDIYEGDKFYFIPAGDNKFEKGIACLEASNTSLAQCAYKRFSTREATEEYIIMNKPCLSINDIISIISFWDYQREDIEVLKQLIKSKLKQKL